MAKCKFSEILQSYFLVLLVHPVGKQLASVQDYANLLWVSLFYQFLVGVFGTHCRNKAGYTCRIMLTCCGLAFFCQFELPFISDAFCF